MIIPKLAGRLAYGADYNPEQWPERIWEEDMALMRQAGVNLVSIGIFSWAKMQPSKNEWEFAWMDRIMDLLAENGIFACLATATASPPAWLTKAHPDILPISAEGATLYPGSRQHYSPNSRKYREAAAALVDKIAERYANHPALAAWHVNNEYACHMPECHGEESTIAFRAWLERRYQSIEALNEAWGTAFWSQIFSSWDEILTPRKAPYFSNPTQQLDFKRFTSDSFLELFLMEKSIIRNHSSDTPVTTNFMGFFKPLDYNRWAEQVDFAAWDSYPDPVDENAGRCLHAAGNDLTRSLGNGKPFVLMEQATSAVNWRDINISKRPGLMRLWSMQSIARGGDGAMCFQWRASISGTEKYHSAMVPHAGAEKSRIFREVSELGNELASLEDVSNTAIRASVAILFDWNAWWSLEVDSRPSRIDYPDWAQRIHRWCFEENIPVDFVHPSADLAEYKAVIAPALYLLSEADAASLQSYVETGGVFLATYFSGIVDESDKVGLGGYPAALKRLLGLWVEEWHPLPIGSENRIRDNEQAISCDSWSETIHLNSAKALFEFENGFCKSGAAFTKNAFGKGYAFYLATRPNQDGMGALLEIVCKETAGIVPILETPDGVEATLRERDGARFLFLLNHNDQDEIVELGALEGIDIASGKTARGQHRLHGLDVSVIRLEK